MSQLVVHPDYPDFKPMLSGKFKDYQKEQTKLTHWPYIASPKVDGFRCVVSHDGMPRTRSLKPIINNFTRERIQYLTRFCPELKYLDGEFIYGDSDYYLTQPNIFQATSSALTTQMGEPTLTFWYFDHFMMPKASYANRLAHITENVYDAVTLLDAKFKDDPHHKIFFKPLPYKFVYSQEELDEYEDECVQKGYEGICFRKVDMPYHFNRSSIAAQHLIKLTRWETHEAVINSVEELEHNDNEAFLDERGYTKRSTAGAGKRGAGTLGAFITTVLNGPYAGSPLRIGTGDGLTESLRAKFWEEKDDLPGQIVTFKWRPHGSKEKPRFPQYKAIRHPDDM